MKMKRCVSLVALMLAISTGSALAADLPSRKAAPVPPSIAYNWSGLYGGLNIGYGWSAGVEQFGTTLFRNNLLDPTLVQIGGPSWSAPSSFGGVTGGGEIGYNFQFSPMFVAGIEADIQGADMNGQRNAIGYYPEIPNPLSPDGITSASTGYAHTATYVNWWGTVRGRMGVLPISSCSNLMVFATGGLAYGGVNSFNSLNTEVEPHLGAGIAHFNNYSTRVGWTAGAGVEWSPLAFPAWSLRVEYLYTDLGTTLGAATGVGITHPAFVNALMATNAYRFNVVRVGLNWHFTPFASAPVMANY